MANRNWENRFIKPEKEAFLDIIEKLEAYEAYKFSKTRSTFTYRDKLHRRELRLNICISFDEDENMGFTVQPEFKIRIHEVHKWFEKFYQGNIRDFRGHSTIHLSELQWIQNIDNRLFFFRKDKQGNWEEELNALKDTLCNIEISFFNKYSNLEYLYYNYTKQHLTNTKLSAGLGKWIFEQLYIVKKVCPKDYIEFLEFTNKSYEDAIIRDEPNMIQYVPYFDEILNELEKF